MGHKVEGCCAPFFGWGELSPRLTQYGLGQGIPLYHVASWSIQPFGRIDMGHKVEGGCCWGKLTQCRLGWDLLCSKWHLNPSIRLATTDMGRKLRVLWPGPRPTSMPSFILIHPTVWPHFTDVTDRTGQIDNGTIGEGKPFYNGRPKKQCNLLSQVLKYNVCTWSRMGSCNWFSYSLVIVIMVALCNRAGHYIFILWFLLLSFFFFSSPILRRRILDVYHTSTHGVALVLI